MNGAEHYREAELLLEQVEAHPDGNPITQASWLAAAQVHAALAQVAATIGTGYARHDAVWAATIDGEAT